MLASLYKFLPVIAVLLALVLGVVYLETRPAPETFDTCVARLSRPEQTEADRSLNRAACSRAGNGGQTPQ